jgi:hypothetical protein
VNAEQRQELREKDDGITKACSPSCGSFHRKFAYLNEGETNPKEMVRCPECGVRL